MRIIMKISIYKFLLGLSFIIQSNVIQAEEESKGLLTIERAKILYPWLMSKNAAGLTVNNFGSLSQVNGGVEYVTGDYRRVDDPEVMTRASVGTESFLSRRDIFFYGSFNFDHIEKRGQAWSGTIKPRSVINMMTDSIPGRVTGENYRISAGVGYRANKTLSAGIGFEYETATAAKRVDGRNRNVASSIEVRPSVMFRKGGFMAGANLIYRHDAERADYIFLGDVTGKHIYNFQGGWMFVREGITNSTVMDRGYFSDYYGASLQGSFCSGNTALYGELTAEYGNENDFDDYNILRRYAFTESMNLSMNAGITITGNSTNHLVKLYAGFKERLSYKIENLYEQVPGEVNTWSWFEYGMTLRYYDRFENYTGSYSIEVGGNRWNPDWVFTLSGVVDRFFGEFIVYPSYYLQEINCAGGELSANRSFAIGKRSLLDISLSGGASKGWGEMMDISNEIESGNLKIASNLLESDYNYTTSGRVIMGGGVKYRYSLSDKKETTLFVNAGFRQIQRRGSSRSLISVSLGLLF